MKSTVLLIDDDPIDLKAMQLLIESWDLDVIAARSGADGLDALQSAPVDLILSDVRMPGMSGDAVVSAVRATGQSVPVILITGHADVRSAVCAMKLGAFDYVVKPPDEDELRMTIERGLEHARLHRENEFLRAELAAGGMYGERLIGRSPKMLAVFEMIDKVARTDSTVLVLGETGTGKELVAQTLHYRSGRANRPLIAVNCASLNPNLIESELFGHEKGAFTGAATARRGRFEEADGGTLFLDEIGEISLEFQSKLLRVLQEQEFERVGGNKTVRADVRLLASTNRDLRGEVASGAFREDLFYRLSVIPLRVPPLRERKEDIPLLAEHFLGVYTERYGNGVMQISPAGMRRLESQEWRGNVRELQHVIERAVVLAGGSTLGPEDLSPLAEQPESADGDETLHGFIEEQSRAHMLGVLERTNWHKRRAAEILGIDRATLYRLLKKHGLMRPSGG